MSDFEELLTIWLEAKFLRGDVDSTLIHAERTVRKFFTFVAADHEPDVRSVTLADLESFKANLYTHTTREGKPLRETTIGSHLTTLRMFFRFLLRRGFIHTDPARNLNLPRFAKKLPRTPFSETEIENMLGLCDSEEASGIRDRAVLETLYSTGMRRGELSNLLLSDVGDETIFIRLGKNRKDRVVPCGLRAAGWIQKYLADARPELMAGNSEHGFLFVNLLGLKLSPSGVSSIVSNKKEEAGIEKKGAAHLIRHTAATLMLSNGADIRHIQEFLGHENIETTKIYTHLTAEKLKITHAAFHPGEKLSVEFRSAKKNRAQLVRVKYTSRTRPGIDFPEEYRAIGEEHLKSLASRGFSKTTQHNRKRYLAVYFNWLLSEGITDLTLITADVLSAYMKAVSQRRQRNGAPLGSRTMNTIVIHVLLFTRWMFDSGKILHDPSLLVDPPKVPKTLPRAVLSANEAQRILTRPDTQTLYGIRDRAILETLYAAGLRRSELVILKLSDFIHEAETLRVYSPKTRSERVVPVGKRASGWIQTYLDRVRPVVEREADILFLASHGGPLHVSMVSQIVLQYMKMAGIKKQDAGHIFRRTCATLLLENGADIRSVQEILGHGKTTSTQVYTKVSIRKLREVHKRTHPAERDPLDKIKPQAGIRALQRQSRKRSAS